MIRTGRKAVLAASALWLLMPVCGGAAEQVVDFERAVPLLADQKANRVPQWVENGVTFTPAWEPKQSKGKALLMFFTHLDSAHKGLASAMATEPIPVRATFAKPVTAVAVSLWGSTGTPAVLEAFDSEGKVVDRRSVESVPARKSPGDPVPVFTMTVKAARIAWVQLSGPREGEYLAADEIRFTTADDKAN